MTRSPTPQHLVNEFLQAELHHTMGSYGVAVTEFERVVAVMDDRREERRFDVLPSRELARTVALNRSLRGIDSPATQVDDRHLHPSPPVTFPDGEEAESKLGPAIDDFYATAEAAIDAADGHRPYGDDRDFPAGGLGDGVLGDADALRLLGVRLGITHDPQRRGQVGGGQAVPVEQSDEERVAAAEDAERRSRQDKLARTQGRRRAVAEDLLASVRRTPADAATVARHVLLSSLASNPGDESLPGLRAGPLHHVAISALVEGHMRMHEVEHQLSGPFEETFTTDGRHADPLQKHLAASVALQTFAYSAARSMPWMFAESEAERDQVLRFYRDSCDAIKPPICLWLANQVSMLALHRRAYSHWLAGDRPRAYRDFYKLKRLIRQVARALERNVNRPPGHNEFLDGLYALAEHHTAGVYQSDHAHDLALRHFNSAAARLKRLSPPAGATDRSPGGNRLPAVLHNSRWRVQLLIGQGKAYYELGRVKASLLCYVEAWKALLQLIDTESRTDSNPDIADDLIEWLRRIVDDPDVNKVQLRDRFAPLIEQFRTMARSGQLTSLAAEIMALIGHVFVVLKLPGERRHRDDGLAWGALTQAAQLSFRSTLLAADLLKIEQRRSPDELLDPDAAPRAPSIDRHWPGGGGKFEQAARVIEYILHSWLDFSQEQDRRKDDEGGPDRRIAEGLLRAYLTHTDSSNVKLAQVYRYLMQEPAPVGDRADRSPRIDLVCARRYSSFFPFLPRPSAFHVRGGGYFVRVLDDGLVDRAVDFDLPQADSKRAFGIVIDPGPDFLDNLYRCGFGLADIDMVIVTHDHADHIASLDALLSLLGYRGILGDERFRPRKPGHDSVLLPIVGNPSVVKRYGFFNARLPKGPSLRDGGKRRKDAAIVMGFDELEEWIGSDGRSSGEDRVLLPPSLRVRPVTSREHTDGHGHLAVGCVVSVEDEAGSASIGFTSDTVWPDDSEDSAWPGDADVVMAHVSGVPVPDLRELAGLDEPPAVAGEIEAFRRLWDQTSEQDIDDEEAASRRNFLLRRLQFGFRSGSANGAGDLTVSPLSPLDEIESSHGKHLYLKGLLALAGRLRVEDPQLLLIGELREELGSFRTRIAAELNNELFGKFDKEPTSASSALTADIGLRVQVSAVAETGEGGRNDGKVKVLCSTCDLDNDLTDRERFHPPSDIYEVCVKGESEGVFYNCRHHDPQSQQEPMYVELVERYDVFGQ